MSGGYNQAQVSGYNPTQGGYNHAQGGYNPAQGGYNPVQGGYNPAQGGYTDMNSFNCQASCGGQQPGYGVSVQQQQLQGRQQPQGWSTVGHTTWSQAGSSPPSNTWSEAGSSPPRSNPSSPSSSRVDWDNEVDKVFMDEIRGFVTDLKH